MSIEIQGKQISTRFVELDKGFLFDPVTYIPGHANGHAGHPDCEQGVVVGVTTHTVKVLYSKSRKVSDTDPNDLVWG